MGLLHPAPAIISGLQGLGAALLGPRAHPLVPGHSPATSTRGAAEGQGCSWGSGQAPGACGAAPAGWPSVTARECVSACRRGRSCCWN